VDAPPRLRVVQASTKATSQLEIKSATDRMQILLRPDTRIDCFVTDGLPLGKDAEDARRTLQALDGNHDGFIDTLEASTAPTPQSFSISAADGDGDGKATADEVESLLRRQRAALRGQIRMSVVDRDDALFAALDHDGDLLLDAREIAQSSRVLAALDRDHDGELSIREIPGSMVVVISRDDAPPNAPLPAGAPASEAPRAANGAPWFAAMDANGDGDISRLEFLGSAEQFSQFDTNQDGFLDADEANRSPAKENAPRR
jgi:Ca2+-binding EF-hand superfamily protein